MDLAQTGNPLISI
ncbi:hypothetical protein F383_25609 [Gossypium arboreum]|uniref:Uncharacterized protein n=1 Tax=Gossypium arboreum TaxID=29729 RepID=A0A0B0N786_GOSAR|nr:hypothetical protein F383_35839 [Gossypium arboreum]KHG19361.1 hypothetical protein F383_25609 [Gossypium arboreum]